MLLLVLLGQAKSFLLYICFHITSIMGCHVQYQWMFAAVGCCDANILRWWRVSWQPSLYQGPVCPFQPAQRAITSGGLKPVCSHQVSQLNYCTYRSITSPSNLCVCQGLWERQCVCVRWCVCVCVLAPAWQLDVVVLLASSTYPDFISRIHAI